MYIPWILLRKPRHSLRITLTGSNVYLPLLLLRRLIARYNSRPWTDELRTLLGGDLQEVHLPLRPNEQPIGGVLSSRGHTGCLERAELAVMVVAIELDAKSIGLSLLHALVAGL